MTIEEIRERLKELKTPLDVVNLEGVYPKLVIEAIGGMNVDTYDLNGWDADYWFSNDKYSVFGTMFNGTARISLSCEEEEEDEK